MLHVIKTLDDALCQLIRDDPVRPEIPLEFRVSERSNIFVLVDDYGLPGAAVCAVYRDTVPQDLVSLAHPNLMTAHVAVFYTIWNYRPGAGRDLILETRDWLRANRPEITTFVTLSPPTEMARRFHLKNGAGILSVNADTVNYIYTDG